MQVAEPRFQSYNEIYAGSQVFFVWLHGESTEVEVNRTFQTKRIFDKKYYYTVRSPLKEQDNTSKCFSVLSQYALKKYIGQNIF